MAPEVPFLDDEILYLFATMRVREEIKDFIKKENLFNAVDSFKNTLLHKCAQSKNTEIATFLINAGSRVDVQNNLGQTPLMLAIANECQGMIEALIEAGANIHTRDNFGSCALQMLGEVGWASKKIGRLFSQKLQTECSNDKSEIAKKLNEAYWPLHQVVHLNDADVTKIMLQRGYASNIDAAASDYLGKTALHVAVVNVDSENVKLLLENNANVNARDVGDRTPLSYLYNYGSLDNPDEKLVILKMLLSRGAIVLSNHFGAYNLFKYGSREAVNVVLQTDIDLSFTTGFSDDTVMHALAENENPGATEELRGKSFNVNVRNADSKTPLMIAAGCGNAEAIQFFLDEGSDIDAVDSKNFSAIFSAIYNGHRNKEHMQCVQILLGRGANVQMETDKCKGSTILDLILDTKHFPLGELVLSHLALQEALGTPITQLIRTQINSCDRFKTHFEASKQRLSTEICQSISLFDLLTVTDKRLERYVMGNEGLISKVPDFVSALSDYRYFHALLQKRLSNAMLKHEAAQIICKIMETNYKRLPLIIDDIISYLESQDMINLIDASL